MLHVRPQDLDQQEQPETEGSGERRQDRHCCLNWRLFCIRIKWQQSKIWMLHRIRPHFHQSTLRENRKPTNGLFSMQEQSWCRLSPRISTRPGSTAWACLLGKDAQFPTHQKTCHKITIVSSKLDVLLIRNRKKYSLQKVSVEAHIELSIRVKSKAQILLHVAWKTVPIWIPRNFYQIWKMKNIIITFNKWWSSYSSDQSPFHSLALPWGFRSL